MPYLRDFLDSTAGKATAGGLLVLSLAAVGYSVWTSGPDSQSAQARTAYFVCTETGKSFDHVISPGDEFPLYSPHSGKKTGVMGELCYWTADGQVKDEPTVVLMNEQVGKKGPTFCPDCGRLVRLRNSRATPGAKPPPKQNEMSKTRLEE